MTDQQRKFYWSAIVTAACEVTGAHPDMTHEILKLDFNPVPSRVNERTGEVLEFRGGSTQRLTIRETIQYFDRIEAWLKENGIAMPVPGQMLEESAC